jgi:hypothetical protein
VVENDIVPGVQTSSAEVDKSLAVRLHGYHSDRARAAEDLGGIAEANVRIDGVEGR